LRGAFFATKQSPDIPGDCFGKKRLAMTGFLPLKLLKDTMNIQKYDLKIMAK
jgi:hypothetical protein